MNPTGLPRTDDEPRLAPDFAARVLHQADLVTRRRRARRVIAGTALFSITAVAIVFGVRTSLPLEDLGPRSVPVYVAAVDSEAVLSAGETDQTDALSYLFPDAAPLTRFSDPYADATDDGDDALAAQDVEEDDASL